MSSRTGKGPAVRSYRRRKTVLDLDLNRTPTCDIREQEGPSIQLGPQEDQANQQPQVLQPQQVQANLQPQVVQPQPVQANQQPHVVQPALIDVESIDDDVIESSPRAFAEAKNNSRRNRGRTIVDVDSEEQARVTNNNRNKSRRVTPTPPIIYVLDGSSGSMRESVQKPPEPPKEPVFNCPICMGPLVEEMSTRCGHIFCKTCIKAAISAQARCPTCRKKITVKELIRVFLPSTS